MATDFGRNTFSSLYLHFPSLISLSFLSSQSPLQIVDQCRPSFGRAFGHGSINNHEAVRHASKYPDLSGIALGTRAPKMHQHCVVEKKILRADDEQGRSKSCQVVTRG